MKYVIYTGISAAVIFIMAALFFALRRFIQHLIDKRISGYQNDLLSKHYEEVQNIYQIMRAWRHDYHNHMQTMKAYLILDQMDELKKYLDMLDDDLKSVDTVIKTGNVRLDAILNSKLSLMTNKDIKMNVKAIVPQKLSVSEIDLCVIIGNLLDNALESCERLDNPEERFVRIYIGVLKQQLYISVTNSTCGNIKKLGKGEYLTIKGQGHGYGLKRMNAIVNKYNGYLNRQDEPDVFATEIMLPL